MDDLRAGQEIELTVRGRLRAVAAHGHCLIIDTAVGSLYVPVEMTEGMLAPAEIKKAVA